MKMFFPTGQSSFDGRSLLPVPSYLPDRIVHLLPFNSSCLTFYTIYCYTLKSSISKRTLHNLSLYVMAALYIAAGVNHFRSPDSYYKIMPSYLSYRYELVYASGGCEIIFGILLVFPPPRRFAALGIVLLLIAVFPANVQMLITYVHEDNPYVWLALLRLPLQLPLIWWAYSFTKNNNRATESES